MFTVEIEGEQELAAAFGRASNIVAQGVARGVMQGVDEGAKEARQNHTFKNRTGNLEKSIEGQALGWTAGGARYEGVIRAAAKYASLVENPTRAHEIRPRRKVWLHWEPTQGDHHFARLVHHPGTKGQPFMGLAFYKAERVIIREVERGIAEAEAVIGR